MKQIMGRGTVLLVASISCLSAALIVVDAEQVSWGGSLIRGRRQALENRQPLAETIPSIGRADGPIRSSATSSVTSASQARSVATATVSRKVNPQVVVAATGTNDGEDDQLGQASELPRPASGSPSSSIQEPDIRPPANSNKRPSGGNRKKPSRQRPARPAAGQDRDDDDCDYDDDDDHDDRDDVDQDDYRQVFNGMVGNPVRQFRRMMDSALDRMQGAYDYYDNDGSGLRVGASSSTGTGRDSFSRAISSVTNNGRTRGLVSETRNGRTQTRRIGGSRNGARGYDDDDGGDEDN